MNEKVAAVQRMQDYISENYAEVITLSDLARVAAYSPFYAFRLFKEYTGYTPADYIRRVRLSASALRLRDERQRVSEVAFDAGFASIDGYQRAFQREFGCNPKEYAKHPVPLTLFTVYGVKFKELAKNMEG